jgi:hypothetical protein
MEKYTIMLNEKDIGIQNTKKGLENMQQEMENVLMSKHDINANMKLQRLNVCD